MSVTQLQRVPFGSGGGKRFHHGKFGEGLLTGPVSNLTLFRAKKLVQIEKLLRIVPC